MRILFSLILFLGVLFADTDQKCDVFTNVLQTRNNPSEIKMEGDGTIYNTPTCSLNTGTVEQGEWYPQLKCDESGGLASATGNYGASLDVNYSFNIESSGVSETPSTSTNDVTITSQGQILSDSDYNEISQDWHYYNYELTYSGDKRINKINYLLNTLTIANLDNTNLYIGDFYIKSDSTKYATINFEGVPNNIYIYDFEANNKVVMNDFEAKDSIKIHKFVFPRYDNDLVIKAPKVVIDDLEQSNSGSGTSKIVIYADEIDINTISLGQDATLEIHPYTPGGKVKFYSNSISASSSSTMLVSSGDYYTNSFDIPGSSDVSSIRAIDDDQIINFYINGDFAPGNNPGINSAGNDGNFGDLPPANFRMYINGDLNTGGGGTTFNALIYVEGSASLGSPTYIKGALSSGDNITIYNGSEFTWDDGISDSGWGQCTQESVDFQNNYACGIFSTALTSYKSISTEQNDVYNTCTISVKDYSLEEDEQHNVTCYDQDHNLCTCDPTKEKCSVNHTCTIVQEPKNKLNYDVYETTKTDSYTVDKTWDSTDDASAGTTSTSGAGGTDINITFNNLEYGNFDFTQDVSYINFLPKYTYSDNNDTKLMILGDVDFNGNGQTITFDGGDYYFRSFKIDKDTNGNINQISICAKGDVRIFVKNDFVYSGNHINNAECGGKIFIYVGGSAYIDANGGGSSTIPMFLYTKGSVNIENSGNSNDWYGAITAEGDINITGENINFIYDDSAGDFGYGDCQLCYALNNNGNWISLFNFLNLEFNFPRDMAIVNNSGQTLNDVNVTQIETSPDFSFSTPAMYKVVDKNGSLIPDKYIVSKVLYSTILGSTTLTNESNDSVVERPPVGSVAGIINSEVNTTVAYGNYPSEGYDNYFMIETYNIEGQFLGANNLNYHATYYDKNGRFYNVELSYCNIPDNLLSKPITGYFDAWDSNKSISDRNITTKIAAKNFVLTLASLNSDNNQTEKKDGIDVKYNLYDMNTSSFISVWKDFNVSNNSEINVSFNIPGVYKDVRVVFQACSDYNGSSYTFYAYDKCSQQCSPNDLITNNNPCWRYLYSSDDFAIRPYKFLLNKISKKIKAGADFNVTVKLLDANNSLINNTDFTDTLEFIAKDLKNCKSGNINPASVDAKFVNGEANVTLSYSEVGDINLTVKEVKNGKEFAKVDEDDTTDTQLLIGSDTNETSYFVPASFLISATVHNYKDSNFTYMSSDLNMSAFVDMNITAQNALGNPTENYNSRCYAQNIDLNLSYADLNLSKLNLSSTQLVSYEVNSTKEHNQSIINHILVLQNINKSNFTTDHNGSAYLKILVNFDKNYTTPSYEFNLTVLDINLSDVNGSSGSKSLSSDNKALFRYGRIKVGSVSGYGSELNTTFYYQYYTNSGWETNTYHTGAVFGDFNHTINNSITPDVSVVNNPVITKGSEAVTFKTTHNLPYSAKVHLSINSWLWYHPLAKPYKDPSVDNTDCLTHPCMNVNFLSNRSGWGGVKAINNEQYSEKNRTTELNTTTKEVNVSKSEVAPINW